MTLTKAHNRMIQGAIVNVQDFGAIGDGLTDDTAAIQAAIDAAANAKLPLFFPDNGTYLISKSTSDACLEVTTDDFSIYGNGATLKLKDNQVDTVTNCLMLYIHGTDTSNRISWFKCFDLKLDGNSANQPDLTGSGAPPYYNSLQITYVNDFYVERCSSYRSYHNGMTCGSSTGTFSNNLCYENIKNGIYVATDTDRVMCIKNRCWENNYDNGLPSAPLFGGTSYSGIGFACDVGHVSDNTCWLNGKGFDISFTGSPEESSINFTFSNNVSHNNRGSGIFVTANTYVDKVLTISDCLSYSNGTAIQANGLNIDNIGYVTVSGGVYRGNSGNGIVAQDGANNFSINGAVCCENTLNGLLLAGTSECIINIVSTDNSRYGIEFLDHNALGVAANTAIVINGYQSGNSLGSINNQTLYARTASISPTFTNVVQYGGAVPTTGSWTRGDFVINTFPILLGAVSSQYIVSGWKRVTTGSGNVLNTDWFEARELTGT